MPADDAPNPSDNVAESNDSSASEPSFAPDHDADTQHPRPGSDDTPVTPAEVHAQQEAVNAALDRVLQQGRKNQSDEDALMQELNSMKAEAAKNPQQPPVPTALPAPPSQEDKNQIATGFTTLLKWGALLGLAYGLRGRSPIRNSIFKGALAAGLEGYYKGQNDVRDRALSVWEKNRQSIMDQNREQHQQYMDTMRDNKLTLQQKMDVFSEQARLWQNKRAQDAASRGDVGAIQKMLEDEMRTERDFEKETRAHREQWYKQLGLSGKQGMEYRDWIISKGGPDIRKAKDEDEEYEIEKTYPIHQMLDEQAATRAKEKTEAAAADAAARQRGKFEEEQKEKKEQGGAADNPLGLNLGN